MVDSEDRTRRWIGGRASVIGTVIAMVALPALLAWDNRSLDATESSSVMSTPGTPSSTPSGSDPAVTSPELAAGGQEGLPIDLLVDGRPQVAEKGVWATFEEGWYPVESASSERWASSPAVLNVHSPDARRVNLRTTVLSAKPNPAGGQSTLRVSVNGGTAETVPVRPGEPLQVAIELEAGLSEVTFELTEGNFVQGDYSPENTDPRPFSFQLKTFDIVSG